MSIDLREWFEILWLNKKTLKPSRAVDQYTGANCIHYWWILGHSELLQKIIETEPTLSRSRDMDGNTPMHYICLNSVSKFSELKEMWRFLKANGANENLKNNLGKTWLQVLKERIQLSNPYDELAKHHIAILKNL